MEPPCKKCHGKANKKLGFVKRKLGFNCPFEIKKLCYTTLVCPLLEYGTIVWNNYNRSNMQQLEAIQHRAIKYVINNHDVDYEVRLQWCDLLPLSFRRDFLDVVYVYNCLNDKMYINLFNCVSEYDALINTRSQDSESLRLKTVVPRL